MARLLAVRTARLALAAVWMHQGLWAKIMDGDTSHGEIVGRIPGMTRPAARGLTVAIGVVEVGMALWVLSGRRPRVCAAVQTGLMAGFNAGALTFARDELDSPEALLMRNAGLVALAWLAAC